MRVNTEVKQQLPTQKHLPPLVNLAAKKLPLLPSFMFWEQQEASIILQEEIFMARRFNSTLQCLRVEQPSCPTAYESLSLHATSPHHSWCSVSLLWSPSSHCWRQHGPPGHPLHLSRAGGPGRHLCSSSDHSASSSPFKTVWSSGKKLVLPRIFDLKQHRA